MQKTLEVCLPAADLEVEIMLAVAWRLRLLRLGHRRGGFLLCKIRLGEARDCKKQDTGSNQVGRFAHDSSRHPRPPSVYACVVCFNRNAPVRDEITVQQ